MNKKICWSPSLCLPSVFLCQEGKSNSPKGSASDARCLALPCSGCAHVAVRPLCFEISYRSSSIPCLCDFASHWTMIHTFGSGFLSELTYVNNQKTNCHLLLSQDEPRINVWKDGSVRGVSRLSSPPVVCRNVRALHAEMRL